jgi:dihydropteroate synthase
MLLVRPLSRLNPSELSLAAARLGLPAERVRAHGWVTLALAGVETDVRSWLRSASIPGGALDEGDADSRPGTALLTGPAQGLAAVAAQAGAAGLAELATALLRALDGGHPPPPLELGRARWTFGARTRVMGVVNVTPDSFSDGGRFLQEDAAVAHGERLASEGADILDVGGESTRPGAARVPVEEELRRVVPVIRRLAGAGALVSVDTSRHEVARAALEAGAVLVNDVSGLRWDPRLAWVVAEARAACCLMHVQGTPDSMQRAPSYADAVEEVMAALAESLSLAEAAGIPRGRVLVDPGIGFGKTAGHNLVLLRRLGELRALGCGVLVGTSRKAFLGKLCGDKPAGERLWATVGSVAAVAARGGADVVRVHDVAEARDALAVADAIREAADGGDLYARTVAGPAGAP